MRILPAIDLLDGKAVRLLRGRYDAVTVYSDEPIEVARRFRTAVDRIHVVDLAGARDGSPAERERVRAIVRAFDGDGVQVGGGIRTREVVDEYLALGASRIVLGTAAVKDRDFLRAIARAHPGVVVVAVDAKAGFVATDGWTETSGVRAIDLVQELAGSPLAAVLYTDVARDGTGTGPNFEATAALAAASPFPIIASGGIGSLEHVRELSTLPNVEAAIVGRALYDGSFRLEDAVRAAGAPSQHG